MESLLPLIIQLIAGAVGGNVGGAALKNSSMGTAGNSIAGAIGGVLGGMGLGPLINMAAEGGFSLGNTATAAVAGLVIQIIAGMIKANMNKG
jgi:hypothetical protein